MSDRGFITPPPGLLPDAPAPKEPEETTGGTAPSVKMPTFFPVTPPTASPVAAPQPVPSSEASTAPTANAAKPGSDAPGFELSVGDVRMHVARDVFIGRAPSVPGGVDADVFAITGENTVSKTHAVLRLGDAGPTLEDLGSTNGTAEVIDGQTRLLAPRTPHPLRLPAVIRLGDATLALAPVVPAPPAAPGS